MVAIYLTQNRLALVDDEDYQVLTGVRWRFQLRNSDSPTGYAVRNIRVEGKKLKLYMHRVITNCPPNLVVDHINGDGLDNRRANLRVTTFRHNSQNCEPVGESRYRGVSRSRNRWRARIVEGDNGQINLGSFDTEEEAALAYDHAALDIFGPFAYTNILPGPFASRDAEIVDPPF